MSRIYLPPPIRRTKRCERCQLHYPAKKPHCTHCCGVNDLELADLQQRHQRQRKAAKNLGKLFAFLAALMLLGLILSSL